VRDLTLPSSFLTDPIIVGSEISGVELVQENKVVITIISVYVFFIDFVFLI
jgi:hypothetical protein